RVVSASRGSCHDGLLDPESELVSIAAMHDRVSDKPSARTFCNDRVGSQVNMYGTKRSQAQTRDTPLEVRCTRRFELCAKPSTGARRSPPNQIPNRGTASQCIVLRIVMRRSELVVLRA